MGCNTRRYCHTLRERSSVEKSLTVKTRNSTWEKWKLYLRCMRETFYIILVMKVEVDGSVTRY